jgi:hypothetical protein
MAIGQDSVALTTCSGGDATSPWDDVSATNGSEQCDDFVVDLNSFTTRWGVTYGIAPLLKTSKSSAGFNSSLGSSQGISRLQRTGNTTAKTYQVWSTPGSGVNNDPAVHTAPTSVSAPCSMNQFGVVMAEFGTTDFLTSYTGLVGATVNFHPANPGRLYVSKVMGATNGNSPLANLAAMGVGSVNEDGTIFFRADGFGATGGGGLTVLSGNNIFGVDLTARDCTKLNVISDDSPGQKDGPALQHYIVNSSDVHSTPNNLPPAVNGGSDFYLGLTFSTTFARGPVGSVATTGGHLAAGTNDMRGVQGYSTSNFGAVSSSAGICCGLGIDAVSGMSDHLNVWGVDAAGGITGTLGCQLPMSITDNSDGFMTLGPAGTLEFDHYHSQTAFQGGNAQVAARVDQNGDLLVAAIVDHPLDGGSDWPVNAVAVCKIDAGTGAETWTLAGWNDGVSGKAILDGPGGTAIGNLIPLNIVTGGTPLGPSMSAPMFDSVGNIYFLSALHINASGDDATGLIRAIYDPGTFSYELDLVFKTGDIFTGSNTGLDYLITFLGIADSNSAASGASWSGNMSDVAHASIPSGGLDTNDNRAMGGVVISASIIYDTDSDGSFDDCAALGADEDYNVLLYVGVDEWENLDKGKAGPGPGFVTPRMAFTGNGTAGSDWNVSLTNMQPGELFFLIAGFSQINSAFKFGTLVPSPDIILPGFPTGAGSFSITSPWPVGLPSCLDLYWQTWITGPASLGNFSATNGIRSTTP